MTTTACDPRIATSNPLPSSAAPAWQAWPGAWRAWRQRQLDAAHRRATLRMLQGLSRRTLRDIGMDDRVPDRPTLSVLDFERGRW